MTESNGKHPDPIELDLSDLDEPMGFFRGDDGKRYDFRQWDAFSFSEQKRYHKQWKRITELEEEDTVGDGAVQDGEYRELRRSLLKFVSTIDDAGLDALGDRKVGTALTGFFALRRHATTTEILRIAAMLPSKSPSTNSSAASTNAGRRKTRASG